MTTFSITVSATDLPDAAKAFLEAISQGREVRVHAADANGDRRPLTPKELGELLEHARSEDGAQNGA